MIIYGTRATGIGQLSIPNTECTHCHQQHTQQIAVFGRYAHVFWIPLFPIGKVVVSECSHCKRTLEKDEFTPALKHKYEQVKADIKRPRWHWTGLAALLLLIAFTGVSSALHEEDPRDTFLQEDLAGLTGTPAENEDSLSYVLKTYLDQLVINEMHPERFEYYSREESDRVLMLIRIPTLRDLDKSARPQILEMVHAVIDGFPHLDGKDRYVGVQNKVNFMLISTPAGEENSRFANYDGLYTFYGPEAN